MPSLNYYLQRAGEQPWRETLKQGQSLLVEVFRRKTQPAWDRFFRSSPSRQEILKRCGFSTAAEMAVHFKRRERPVFPEFPIEMGSAAADSETDLRTPVAWHTDKRSGYKWNPEIHYRQVPLAPKNGVDIKGPWELSRCHQMVILGQRYRATADEKYAAEFVLQCRDWIQSNPCRYGVNWVSAMEAGIRAVNWVVAFSLMRNARAVDDAFVLDFVTSLYAHADFIRTNLEYREAWIDGKFQRLNSNHYLCDLAGLLHICLLFPELRLDVEMEFAAKELETELFCQTTEDGIDYENSTSYHRFVLEILLACFSLLERNGYSLKTEVGNRLRQMEDFAAAYSHPDGSIPQIGDNDSGSILPTRLVKYVPATVSSGFADPGFYSMRGRDSHVFVSAATVGMRGFGSHSHNDILSFEYWNRGQPWIIDPGTYMYLGDPAARNWFRSTAAHNTVQIDGEEINPFHPEAVFQMVDQAKVRLDVWRVSEREDILEAAHTGYERLNGGITHRRRFTFDKDVGRLLIQDFIEGGGRHKIEWFLQIHPSIKVDPQPDMVILSHATMRIRVRVECPGAGVECVDGWYSRRYGHREPTSRIVVRLETTTPVSAQIAIEPC